MRRIFFIVLLALLPVQLSWSAAAAYCRHESGGAVKHFGHHEHQHRAAADVDTKDTKSSPSPSKSADSDCATCHLPAAQPIPVVRADVPSPSTDPPRFGHEARYNSFIPSGPERPDRTSPTPAVRFGGAVVIGALL